MLDAIVTYAIVAIASGFVVWRFFLPVRSRLRLKHAIAGTTAPCEPLAETQGCAGGCSGCALASRHEPRREAAARSGSPHC